MIITRSQVVDVLLKYINRHMSLSALVDWAERALNDADFEAGYFEEIRDVVSRIGLADVRDFGLSWDDCYDYLHKLGYDVKVELSAVK